MLLTSWHAMSPGPAEARGLTQPLPTVLSSASELLLPRRASVSLLLGEGASLQSSLVPQVRPLPLLLVWLLRPPPVHSLARMTLPGALAGGDTTPTALPPPAGTTAAAAAATLLAAAAASPNRAAVARPQTAAAPAVPGAVGFQSSRKSVRSAGSSPAARRCMLAVLKRRLTSVLGWLITRKESNPTDNLRATFSSPSNLWQAGHQKVLLSDLRRMQGKGVVDHCTVLARAIQVR